MDTRGPLDVVCHIPCMLAPSTAAKSRGRSTLSGELDKRKRGLDPKPKAGCERKDDVVCRPNPDCWASRGPGTVMSLPAYLL